MTRTIAAMLAHTPIVKREPPKPLAPVMTRDEFLDELFKCDTQGKSIRKWHVAKTIEHGITPDEYDAYKANRLTH